MGGTNSAVAELVALIGDENERKQLQALLEKYPRLAEGHLRQSDYDRLMNKAKQDIAAAEAKANEGREWYDRNVKKHDELLTAYDALEKENVDLKAKVEEAVKKAAAAPGTGAAGAAIDQETVVKNVLAQIGGRPMSGAEIKDAVKAAVKEASDGLQKDFFEKTFPQATRWQSKLLDAKLRHHDEFKERLDDEALMKFMVENKIEDVEKGYEMFVAPKRNEKKIKEEVDKRLADELAKRGMPGVSSATPPPELGPLQTMLQKKGPTLQEGQRPGDGSLALQAADALRAEGKT